MSKPAAVQLSIWPEPQPQADYVAEYRRILRYAGYKSLADCYRRTNPRRMVDGKLEPIPFAEIWPQGDVTL